MAFLAGRPPFATDIPDSAYAQPQPQARYKQPPRDDPNARSSAYNQCVFSPFTGHPVVIFGFVFSCSYDAYLTGGSESLVETWSNLCLWVGYRCTILSTTNASTSCRSKAGLCCTNCCTKYVRTIPIRYRFLSSWYPCTHESWPAWDYTYVACCCSATPPSCTDFRAQYSPSSAANHDPHPSGLCATINAY
jgi:hypothetical protein